MYMYLLSYYRYIYIPYYFLIYITLLLTLLLYIYIPCYLFIYIFPSALQGIASSAGGGGARRGDRNRGTAATRGLGGGPEVIVQTL